MNTYDPMTEFSKGEWIGKEDLPPVPPRDEWGTNENFDKFKWIKNKNNQIKVPRCMAWSKRKLRQGLRNEEAQCPHKAVRGKLYCHEHAKRFDRTHKWNPEKTIERELHRYMKYTPKHLLQKMVEAWQDPNKLSLEAEIDVLTARASELMERIEERQSATAWRQVEDARILLRDVLGGSQPANQLNTVLQILNRATKNSDYSAWMEFMSVLRERKSYVESERRRALEMGEMLSIEELMGTIAWIQQAVFRIVTDYESRQAISQELRSFINPIPHELPAPQQVDNRRKPDYLGCEVCSNKEFRRRNEGEDGRFVCPQCGEIWQNEMKTSHKANRERRRERRTAKKVRKARKEGRVKKLSDLGFSA